MDGITFSEKEQVVFGDLFSSLDEGTGRISGTRGMDLLKRSGLPPDTIQKVFELSGASRIGSFGRSQFYLALKLVAAAQSGIPLSPDCLRMTSTKTIPLPQFSSNNGNNHRHSSPSTHLHGHHHSQPQHSICSKSSPSSFSASSSPSSLNSPASSSPSLIPPPSKPSTGRRTRKTSSLKKSINKNLTPSSSPEPGSSPRALADQGWQSFVDEKDEKWTSVSEEGCRLIEGEEDEEDDADEGTDGSDEEDDAWIVSDDQRDYYVKQFLSISPDGPHGKVTGTVAKEFFELSKLSTTDLSKIWQLADVDRDGALSIAEFCVAMHLVVLRRNHIDLPRILPQALWSACREKTRSFVSRSQEIHLDTQVPPLQTSSQSASSSLLDLSPPTTNPPQHQHLSSKPNFHLTTSHSFNNIAGHATQNNRSSSQQNLTASSLTTTGDQKWTKFSDSPTVEKSSSSGQPTIEKAPFFTTTNVCSLGIGVDQPPPLANFDFSVSSIESDPQIIHPIPVRVTPEVPTLTKLAPPPPPPRPHRQGSSGHARSSSLDLNRLSSTGRSTLSDSFQLQQQQHHSMSNCFSSPSPAVGGLPSLLSRTPTGLSPTPNVSIFHVDPSSGAQSHGAFTVYRKRVNNNNGATQQGQHLVLTPGSPSSTSSSSSLGGFTTSQYPGQSNIDEMLSLLRSKYSLPHESFIPCNPNDPQELLRCLKGLSERNLKIEKLNERLIQDLAQVLSTNQRLEGMMSHLNLGGAGSQSRR